MRSDHRMKTLLIGLALSVVTAAPLADSYTSPEPVQMLYTALDTRAHNSATSGPANDVPII